MGIIVFLSFTVFVSNIFDVIDKYRQREDKLVTKFDTFARAYELRSTWKLEPELMMECNRLYGPVFPEPQILLTEVPKLAGTDGKKMSNSFGNAIYLKDSPEIVKQKISTMMTDTRRKRKTDPGVPEDCPVFTLHRAFVAKKRREELAQGCRTAGIGCLECKNVVIDSLLNLLTSYREKRDKFEKKPQLVWEILEDGNDKARRVAQKTMEEVRSAIGL